jgi:hypothetical protein
MNLIEEYRKAIKDVALDIDKAEFEGTPIDQMNEAELVETLLYLYDNDQLSQDGRKMVEYTEYLSMLSTEEVLTLATGTNPRCRCWIVPVVSEV